MIDYVICGPWTEAVRYYCEDVSCCNTARLWLMVLRTRHGGPCQHRSLRRGNKGAQALRGRKHGGGCVWDKSEALHPYLRYSMVTGRPVLCEGLCITAQSALTRAGCGATRWHSRKENSPSSSLLSGTHVGARIGRHGGHGGHGGSSTIGPVVLRAPIGFLARPGSSRPIQRGREGAGASHKTLRAG